MLLGARVDYYVHGQSNPTPHRVYSCIRMGIQTVNSDIAPVNPRRVRVARPLPGPTYVVKLHLAQQILSQLWHVVVWHHALYPSHQLAQGGCVPLLSVNIKLALGNLVNSLA
jgi:hypothetical protein